MTIAEQVAQLIKEHQSKIVDDCESPSLKAAEALADKYSDIQPEPFGLPIGGYTGVLQYGVEPSKSE